MLKKVVFFYKRFKTDLKENINIPIVDDKNELLSRYYINFDPKAVNSRGGNSPFQFDENGVPMIMPYIDVPKEQRVYSYYPITIGQFALAIYHSYIDTKSEEKKKHFLRIANWFYDNRTEDEEHGVYWLSKVPKPEYKVFKPWKSAFSQSRGLSILLRAWQLTGDEKYLEVCKKALIPFTYDISEGGVSVDREKGETFYEEYVAEMPTRVLDGHGFSLFGLYDFVRAVPKSLDEESHLLAKKLFDEGIQGLEKQLPKFDMGFWMLFNRCPLAHYPKKDPCTIGYLRLVTAQLKILDSMVESEIFKNYIKKMIRYDNLFSILRMYPIKFLALKKLNRI
jgi:hypothetical protein